MNAGEPDLLDAGIGFPQQGLKRGARVIDAQRLAGVFYFAIQFEVWKFEPMDQSVDEVAGMERSADGIDGVPNAEESDVDFILDAVLGLKFVHRFGIHLSQPPAGLFPAEHILEPGSIR